ncbi:hypothetical protein [Cobetia amphilecti]|uniref:hypothetical protein n=2 Tax=Cobetia amphilecti TaxID=1055104 RepID=UPI0036F1FA69
MSSMTPGSLIFLAILWFIACRFLYKPESKHAWGKVFLSTGWRLGLMFWLATFIESSTSGILHPHHGLKVAIKAVIVALAALWFFRLWSGLLDEHTSVGRSVTEFAVACWVLDTSTEVLGAQGIDTEGLLFVLLEVSALLCVLVAIHKAISKFKKAVLENKSERYRTNVGRLVTGVVLAPFVIAPLYMAILAYEGQSEAILAVAGLGKIITIYSTATEFLMEYV